MRPLAGAEKQALLRRLPSVDQLAASASPALPLPDGYVTQVSRALIQKARQQLLAGADADTTLQELPERLAQALSAFAQPSLQPVINATGVVLHTNLGRAPLPRFEPIRGYSNLEYDIAKGTRGKRDAHVRPLLQQLLGCPAIAVNNNAAAVYLVLKELAAGGEVIVSRGELVEIGDGFRIPDIMVAAGVTLREVGTTNRTHLRDYESAINDNTRLILTVHPSNFAITGFTAKPSLAELSALGRNRGIPVYEDLGSGCLVDLRPLGVTEPLVQDSLKAGVDLVSFSTDKLFGGPQSGIIAGNGGLVERLRRNPMYRAFRLDKLMVQALEQSLRHMILRDYQQVPALRMIQMLPDELFARAATLAGALPSASVVAGESVIGGGSTPNQSLPTWLVRLDAESPSRLDRALRRQRPAVVARVDAGAVLFDLRTVLPEQDNELIALIQDAIKAGPLPIDQV